MIAYDFKNLSPADFEDLSRDLIGKELEVRFEAFSEGADGGIDGRHSKDSNLKILQAKHYAGSAFNTLKTRMKREMVSVHNLNPTRYILATSHPLTPHKKKSLLEVIGAKCLSENDIFGPNDLNDLLRKYPEIEKSHIKLWLNSTSVLERIINSPAHTYNSITLDEIKSKLNVYAVNPSLQRAREILEKHRILIISGPPGVGKTTLAEILSYAYIYKKWDMKSIRSLENGFASIDDTKNQIFLFDDFLGQITLDRNSLSQKDSDLNKFLTKIRNSEKTRFVLTTRAYILEEAKRSSEYLSCPALDAAKYLLDVGTYTRRIKAKILYNHLVFFKVPKEYISALVKSESIINIIDHKNYNPRIVEWMTTKARLINIQENEYSKYFLDGLNNPQRLWDHAFMSLSKRCQHLLMCLFFCSEYGVEIDDLEAIYRSLHARLCKKYGEPYHPKDFKESLKILEGSFISINRNTTTLINPSLKDYLAEYLRDLTLISEFPFCATSSGWAKALWKFGERQFKNSKCQLKNFASSFANAAGKFLEQPVWRYEKTIFSYILSGIDLHNLGRILLLIEWWEASQSDEFISHALFLCANPIDGLDPGRDGAEALELIYKLRSEDYYENLSCKDELADALEMSLKIMLEKPMSPDDLEGISDGFHNWERHCLGEDVVNVYLASIQKQFEEVADIVSNFYSDSTLHDHITFLKKLGERSGFEPAYINKTIDVVQSRICEIQDQEAQEAVAPTLNNRDEYLDKFDDAELLNLFMPLLDVE